MTKAEIQDIIWEIEARNRHSHDHDSIVAYLIAWLAQRELDRAVQQDEQQAALEDAHAASLEKD